MPAYGDKLLTEPVSEPLSQSQVKTHLGLPEALQDFDTQIDVLISAARQFVEDTCNRQLVTATREITFDAFPPIGNAPMHIPRGPLQSVTEVKYIDPEGNSQTLESANYTVDAATLPGRIQPVDRWPATALRIGAVTVTIVCGYGDASAVPPAMQQLLLQMVDDWLNKRSGEGEIGQAMQALLNSQKTGDAWLYGQGF